MALDMWKRADISDLRIEHQSEKTNFGNAMGGIVNSIRPIAFYTDIWFWLWLVSSLFFLLSAGLNIYQKLEANRLKYELKMMRGTEDVEEETKHEEHTGKDHWVKTTKKMKRSTTQVAGSLSVTVEKGTPTATHEPSTSSCQEISE
ncbi:hypothetical protein WR25_23885 [Diploscapter pachys]|uniref:Uncharacterized protein n=1 Tax=Diploscapter pachys TaxID=2018661 RepID=A0A2A2KER4_9BILA|nr:hypothetical protein WR25_23885 [Diploscapter pachys]